MLLASKHLETRCEETVDAEDTKRRLTDMHLKELLEEEWAAFEGDEDLVAETRGAIQQEEGARHEAGKAPNTPVGLLIEGEIVVLECNCQSCGLAEAESETFAGDGVNGA
jgi:hypothetical protein